MISEHKNPFKANKFGIEYRARIALAQDFGTEATIVEGFEIVIIRIDTFSMPFKKKYFCKIIPYELQQSTLSLDGMRGRSYWREA